MIGNLEKANTMSQAFLQLLYKLASGDNSDFEQVKRQDYDECVEMLNFLKYEREKLENSSKRDINLIREMMKKEYKLSQHIKPSYFVKTSKVLGCDLDREQMWLNVLRFASLFLNDGKINLFYKNTVENAVNGKFIFKTTSKPEELQKFVKASEKCDMTAEQMDIIAKLYRIQSMGNNIQTEKLKKVEEFVGWDKVKNELFPINKSWVITCLEDGSVKVRFDKNNDISAVVIINNGGKDGKYTLCYESSALRVYDNNIFRSNSKGEKVAVSNQITPPNEILGYFRNANAHASRYNFNEKKREFSLKMPNQHTIIYNFGWLEGYTSMFLNDNFCRLYGKNSQYNALPGWKYDNERKARLKPNNEFPIVVNKMLEEPFRSFKDVEEYLRARKFYRVTINDDISMLDAQIFYESVMFQLFEESKGDEKRDYLFIKNKLNSAKIKDYRIETVSINESKLEKYLKYWEARLNDIPNFYNLEINDQYNYIFSIDKINKFNLGGINGYEDHSLNNEIFTKLLDMLSVNALNKMTKNKMIFDELRLPAKKIEDLQFYKQEFAPVIVTMMVYNALICSGYADCMCNYSCKENVYQQVMQSDLLRLAKLDFSDFIISGMKNNKPYVIKGDKSSNKLDDKVNVKRDIVRVIRHAIAHGRVEVLNMDTYKDNIDTIELCFHSFPPNSRDKSETIVRANLGALRKTFTNKMFITLTDTKITEKFPGLNINNNIVK